MNIRKEKSMQPDIFKNVSPLGFGIMRLPMEGNAVAKSAFKLVEEAVDLGVNYFDMGYTYQNGYAEEFIGQALVKQYKRSDFYIATKMPLWEVHSEGDLERIFQDQLTRLGVEYIDYYLAHLVTKFSWQAMEQFDIKGFFDRKRKEGRIRHLGFSFHDTPEVLSEIIDDYNWEFCQLQINFLDWKIRDAQHLYNVATDKGLPIVVMEPLTGGGLARLSDDCKTIMYEKHSDWSVASWGMRFVGRLPNVAVVLSGMNASEQITDNVKTLFNSPNLSEEDFNVLEKVVDLISDEHLVPCSTCGYCLKKCPMDIQIPGLFQAFNEAKTFGTGLFFCRHDVILATGPRAEACIQCGKCMSICPQKIDIPKYMRFFKSMVANRSHALQYSISENMNQYVSEQETEI